MKTSFISAVIAAAITFISASDAHAAWVREQGRPHVYFVGNGYYCHVISEEQLASYNLHWTQTSELSSAEYARLVGGLANHGSCKWPDGCYRQSTVREVYRVNGSNACWVSSEAELSRHCPSGVKPISTSVRDLHSYTGPC